MIVWLVKGWGIEYSDVLGVYANERGAIQAVRRRMLTYDGWTLEGAVQRAHRRRVWRSRRQATAHRWVSGPRAWCCYHLHGARHYPRRRAMEEANHHVSGLPTFMWSPRETGCSDHYGVFPYHVEE